MSDLIELAARCEAATGPDRELDAEIASQLSGHEAYLVTIGPDHRREEWVFISTDAGDASPTSRPVPRYTSSLDAAMTLVPEGWFLNLLTELDQRNWEVSLRSPILDDFRRFATSRTYGNEKGVATPALALCTAALRAREAETPSLNSNPHPGDA